LRYLVFAFNIGNLGRHAGRREPVAECLRRLNQELAPDVAVLASFRHTGNFIVDSKLPSEDVAEEIARAIPAKCAVLTIEDVVNLIAEVGRHRRPASKQGIRWTPGLAFRIDEGEPSGLANQSRVKFARLTPTVTAAWKRDRLTSRGILDRANRDGGWGGVARDAAEAFGGLWTARSLSTVVGLLKKSGSERQPRKVIVSGSRRRIVSL